MHKFDIRPQFFSVDYVSSDLELYRLKYWLVFEKSWELYVCD